MTATLIPETTHFSYWFWLIKSARPSASFPSNFTHKIGRICFWKTFARMLCAVEEKRSTRSVRDFLILSSKPHFARKAARRLLLTVEHRLGLTLILPSGECFFCCRFTCCLGELFDKQACNAPNKYITSFEWLITLSGNGERLLSRLF